MQLKQAPLVIGVDFGTTYTGISYGLAEDLDRDDPIIAITDWPSTESQTEHAAKVPTQISYEPDETGVAANCWGYLIKPAMPRCVWMKLLLDKNARVTPNDDPGLLEALEQIEAKLPPGKTVQQITTDFFKELYYFTVQNLSNDFPELSIDTTPIQYSFTMPAIWSDEAQQNTLWAAAKAGFGARRGDEVSVITEPEAAALATLMDSGKFWGDDIGEREEGVLVCDCGGGTVDLTAYTVVSDDPWQLKEIEIGDGGKYGATNLDRELLKLLRGRFGRKFDSLPESVIGPGSDLMKDFEWNKRIFDEPGPTPNPLRLVMNEKESDHYDELDGKVILTHEDMKKIFDPVVERTINLIKGQVERRSRGSGAKITYLLLVGGLGDSPYLRRRLKSWCVQNYIRVGGPTESWGAVVRGAVLHGLGKGTVVQKICRRHYGMMLSIPYDPREHGHGRATCISPFDGVTYVEGYMEWSIERGTVFTPDGSKPIKFFEDRSSDDRELTLTLESCSLDEAPEWYDEDEVERTANMTADLSEINFEQFESRVIGGSKQYRVRFILEVVLGHTQGTVGFQLRVGEQLVGQTSIKLE